MEVHVFVVFTVGWVVPTVTLANTCFCGCWCWALAPFSCLVCCLSDETQIWPGDLRVVFVCGLCDGFLIGFAAQHMTTVLCAYVKITDASSHVRTEPIERHRPNRRKKKRYIAL